MNWWIGLESTLLVVRGRNSMTWKDCLGSSVFCEVFEQIAG